MHILILEIPGKFYNNNKRLFDGTLYNRVIEALLWWKTSKDPHDDQQMWKKELAIHPRNSCKLFPYTTTTLLVWVMI